MDISLCDGERYEKSIEDPLCCRERLLYLHYLVMYCYVSPSSLLVNSFSQAHIASEISAHRCTTVHRGHPEHNTIHHLVIDKQTHPFVNSFRLTPCVS